MNNPQCKVLKSAILASIAIGIASCKATESRVIPEPVEMKGEAIPATNLKKSIVKMNLNEQVAFARNDLAKRLDVKVESVLLLNARTVTWRSGALGCPKPGMAYTDALVPGVSIFLKVDNSLHAYHAKTEGNPFYCPRERVEQPVLDKTRDVT